LKCLQQTYQNIEVLIITHNSSDGMRKKAKANDVWLRSFDLGTKQSAKAIDLSYCIEQSSKGAAFGNICCSNSFKGQNI
ncbi:MAG: glycosyltransferase family A protein, partial [Nitrososphaeraceae archaeon]